MKRLIFLIFLVILSSPVLVFAQDIDEYLENHDKLIEDYNKNIDSVPKILKKLFGDERIKIYLGHFESTRTFSAETRNARLISFKEEEIENPTLVVYVNKETLDSIINSENPAASLTSALDSGEIKYEAVGIKTKIKLFFTSLFLKFL